MTTHRVSRTARRATDSTALRAAARVGFVVNGLMHVLIGWIALQVAFSAGNKAGSGRADQSGALSTLAENPVGRILLWVAVIGFLGLALWQVAEAIAGRETGDRIKAVAKAAVYIAVGWSAFTFARGDSSSSGQQSRKSTHTLLDAPLGVALVIAVGLAVLAVGGYHVYKGWAKKFLEDLHEHPGTLLTRIGQVGYVAKGVALAVVGGLFITAAITHDPKKSSGLDGALRTLRDAPAGQILLVLVAVGLIAYGIYCAARARYGEV